MIFLAPIVFVGVAGTHHEVVERQLAPVLAQAGVTARAIPAKDLAQIARHTDASKEIIKRLHVDGVIGGALITVGGQQTFRVVVYDGAGNMRSLDESPLAGKKLGSGDLEVLASNLGDEVHDLGGGHKPEPTESVAEIEIDPPKPMAPTETKPDAPREVADANSVSLDEIEAVTGDTNAQVDAVATAPSSSTLHLHIGAGLALIGRVFTPPMALNGFSSTPVGGAQFAAGLSPTERTSIEVMAERTVAMSTNLGSTSASTVISRWQVNAGYALVARGTQIVANVGLGNRAFSIESSDPSRTPDNEYNYVALGARIAQPLGERLVARGNVELEPVFGGVDGMQVTLGPSTRWGLDLGAALEYRLAAHLVARGAFDYQRFSWSWDGAGARAAGGGSDSYPSGSLALRTEF